ncbi:putative nucleotidyltransferase [Flavobacterium sp. CG_9.10]|uniref:nucleotidyltransferase domain-containing protein n=1 Tax=Flavobacterium sp. CG_9.10 TaxID=2787729 RepID=UPI0018C9A367|nr:nucleotidyltransferase domain-containing protein [Flavobacterium sp. CG_9.10]MBG6111727.1 putative nucleotidyltransferase [Flavobacterium sp. CG_9.10]
MKYGISDKNLNLLKNIFEKYDSIEEVILYGSRAKGNYSDRSDIDLAVKGNGIDRHLIGAVSLEFSDSDFPFKIDLQDISEINNLKLLEHINRVGQIFYKK